MATRSGESGEMNHSVDRFHTSGDNPFVPDIANPNFQVPIFSVTTEVCLTTVRKVVDQRDLVTFFEKAIRDVTSDEPRSPRDKDTQPCRSPEWCCLGTA